MTTKDKYSEVSFGSTSVKEIFHFINPDRKVKVLSREVYKNLDRQIHYPFRTDTGEQKYLTIKKIIFNGFDGRLPRGVYKNFTRGFGFTRVLNPLLFYLQDKFEIESVIVNSAGASILNKKKKEVTLSNKDLE